MNTFGEQLKNRLESDQKAIKENEEILGSVINGRSDSLNLGDMSAENNLRQLETIIQYMKLDMPDYVTPEKSLTELIEQFLRPSGAKKRSVRLEAPWWKDSDGPLLVKIKDSGQLLALLPAVFGGYYYFEQKTGKKIRITKENAELFEEEAYCFYLPLPQKPVSGKEFLLFLLRQIQIQDIVMYVLTSIFMALIGTLTPVATNIAFSQIIPTGKVPLLFSLFILLVATAFSSFLMRSSRFSINLRIQTRLDIVAENCVYSRVLNLPSSFFKQYTAGGLYKRIRSLNRLPKMIGDFLMMLTSVLISLVSAIPIFFIAPELSAPALIAILVMLATFAISVLQEQKLVHKGLAADEENSGLVFGMISGIERLRISGSEDRAYAKWLRVYAKKAGASYAIRFPLCIRNELILIIKLAGLLWAFIIAFNCQLSVAQLAAFSSAYGIAIGCISTIVNHGRNISRIKPVLDMGEPILQAVPEPTEGKKVLKRLNGNVSVNHITFRYERDDPPVLDDLSINIHSGEYVAIVGKSGCGKSTLVKLLLGFETPEQGTIVYDDNDINQLDMHALRRCIGTVLQNGKLFAGDLYSNITITAPWLGVEDAWDAAEKAGMADDIRKMPQGMNTILSEGSGSLSGGQKQRLMIARAIVSKPGLLIFDEATSALDNLTQKIVTESLNEMHCTRIVIAHRLSTIRECDRIIALEGGKIIESGTYDELMSKNGFFAELVARQQV